MREGKVRKLAVLIGLGVVVGFVISKLRGRPAPQFSNHPTVTGGPRPGLVPAPTDPTVPAPADASTALVPAPEDPTVPAHDPAPTPSPSPPGQAELDLEPLVPAPADPTVAADADLVLVPAPADPTVPGAGSAADAGPEGHAWVEPVDGGCPDGYPIKAKVKSGIFHQPGGLAYDRTKPDRCYPDAASAEADGLRAAKR